MSSVSHDREAVLVFQIGSLGDTVISLPAYREIVRRHPHAARHLLTNFPIGSKMVQAEAILKPTGVIEATIEYPMPLRSFRQMLELRRRIRALAPSTLYYLVHERRLANLVRHYLFFKFCGIARVYGLPWSRDRRSHRALPGGLWESEASRLLRNIGVAQRPPTREQRNLAITLEEQKAANTVLSELRSAANFIVVSVGGKVPLNDWGDANWIEFLRSLSLGQPNLGLALVGSADERSRNQTLASFWRGPALNTCGLLTPRESAALIARAKLFVGHDTSTLHLAAAVNVPIVGIYSARNLPGVWFSDQPSDVFFYEKVGCAGCGLTELAQCRNQRTCMTSHDVAAVLDAARRHLSQIEHEAVHARCGEAR